jgi:long-chain acyl-CoA synthetase
VSPKEVETVIYELPGVTGVAVFGTPDPLLGSAVTAVVLTGGASLLEQDVLRHCARRLEDFAVPKRVHFVTELPRTESGKIDRRRIAMTFQNPTVTS